MPRPQNTRTASLEVERRRQEQVINQAQSLFNKKGQTAAGLYLCDKLEMEAVQQILAGLPDAAQLHLPSLSAPPTVDPVQPALETLKRLGMVLTGLSSVEQKSPKALPLLLKCFELIYERWDEITTWTMFFIRYTSVSGSTWSERLNACIWVIKPIVSDPDGHPYQEEMVSTPATINIILHLLRLTDPTTGKPAILEDKPGSKCVIADVYGVCVMSVAGFQSVLSCLYSMPRRTTKQFSQSIVARIQHILESPRDSKHRRQISEDLFHLISPTCLLGITTHGERDIGQEDVVYESARVLSIILEETATDKATRPVPVLLEQGLNELVMLAIGTNTAKDVLINLFEGGIVPCVLRSILFGDDTTPRGIESPACSLLPFLTDSDVFRAAQEGGLNQALFDALEACEKSKAVESIFSAYSLTLKLSESSFEKRKGRPLHFCCNLKHAAKPADQTEQPTVKTCGRCRSVFYCSGTCQKEDWHAFHSKECTRASPHRKTSKKLEIGVDTRRDKLAFLEVLANRFLPALPDLIQRTKGSTANPPGIEGPTSSDFNVADTFINVFDLTSKNFKRHKLFKFVDFENTPLTSYLQKYKRQLGMNSPSRILQCSQDVQLTPESTVLVAGMFVGQSTIISVCAKMEYRADAPLGERYSAVSHVFGACARR